MPSCDYSFPTLSCSAPGSPRYYISFKGEIATTHRCTKHAKSGIYTLFDTAEEALQTQITQALCKNA